MHALMVTSILLLSSEPGGPQPRAAHRAPAAAAPCASARSPSRGGSTARAAAARAAAAPVRASSCHPCLYMMHAYICRGKLLLSASAPLKALGRRRRSETETAPAHRRPLAAAPALIATPPDRS